MYKSILLSFLVCYSLSIFVQVDNALLNYDLLRSLEQISNKTGQNDHQKKGNISSKKNNYYFFSLLLIIIGGGLLLQYHQILIDMVKQLFRTQDFALIQSLQDQIEVLKKQQKRTEDLEDKVISLQKQQDDFIQKKEVNKKEIEKKIEYEAKKARYHSRNNNTDHTNRELQDQLMLTLLSNTGNKVVTSPWYIKLVIGTSVMLVGIFFYKRFALAKKALSLAWNCTKDTAKVAYTFIANTGREPNITKNQVDESLLELENNLTNHINNQIDTIRNNLDKENLQIKEIFNNINQQLSNIRDISNSNVETITQLKKTTETLTNNMEQELNILQEHNKTTEKKNNEIDIIIQSLSSKKNEIETLQSTVEKLTNGHKSLMNNFAILNDNITQADPKKKRTKKHPLSTSNSQFSNNKLTQD